MAGASQRFRETRQLAVPDRGRTHQVEVIISINTMISRYPGERWQESVLRLREERICQGDNQNICPTGIKTHKKRLQTELVVDDKYWKVASYANAIVSEIETIAYSVGVSELRDINIRHMRIVQPDDKTVSLENIWPSYTRTTMS